MPITRSDEIADGRKASDSFEYKGEATRVWRVQTDDNDIDAVEILDSAHLASPDPVALIGAVHPSSSILYCKTRSCDPDGDDGRSWKVTANYDNQFSEDPADRQSNPTNRVVKYWLEWGQYSRLCVRDAEDVLILNTVNDRFDEPLEQEDSRPILVAVRNHAVSELPSIISLAVEYKDAVNSDTFYGAQPGFVKMAPIQTGEPQFENGVAFYSVRYEFHFHEEPSPGVEGWEREILNRGNRAYASANDPFSRYQLKDGPKNLNEDGTVQTGSDEPHYVRAKTYRRRPFGALNL